jgi:hypothetical protein
MGIIDGFYKKFGRRDPVHSLQKGELWTAAERVRKQTGFIVFVEKV